MQKGCMVENYVAGSHTIPHSVSAALANCRSTSAAQRGVVLGMVRVRIVRLTKNVPSHIFLNSGLDSTPELSTDLLRVSKLQFFRGPKTLQAFNDVNEVLSDATPDVNCSPSPTARMSISIASSNNAGGEMLQQFVRVKLQQTLWIADGEQTAPQPWPTDGPSNTDVPEGRIALRVSLIYPHRNGIILNLLYREVQRFPEVHSYGLADQPAQCVWWKRFRNIHIKTTSPIMFAVFRSMLELNLRTCSPPVLKDIRLLGGVQRPTTKRFVESRQLSHTTRLKQLNMFSLRHFRLQSVIIAYTVHLEPAHPYIRLPQPTDEVSRRRKSINFVRERSKPYRGSNPFPWRPSTYWNVQLVQIVMAASTESAKLPVDRSHNEMQSTIDHLPDQLHYRVKRKR
ncbi:hypothetical protein P879_06933 [Paragonimus westermani]|uniref:Uncharacterized protein n=1 Tax=Paragonimus westermani TaxID=34504 RepID=A0A8T0CYD3_9TREM|nr:hypothetical protein P879_06933 [Paragonimus westermani]